MTVIFFKDLCEKNTMLNKIFWLFALLVRKLKWYVAQDKVRILKDLHTHSLPTKVFSLMIIVVAIRGNLPHYIQSFNFLCNFQLQPGLEVSSFWEISKHLCGCAVIWCGPNLHKLANPNTNAVVQGFGCVCQFAITTETSGELSPLSKASKSGEKHAPPLTLHLLFMGDAGCKW